MGILLANLEFKSLHLRVLFEREILACIVDLYILISYVYIYIHIFIDSIFVTPICFQAQALTEIEGLVSAGPGLCH